MLKQQLGDALNSGPLYSQGSNKGFIITQWGRVLHICVNKLTIIGSDNGLSPGRRQAIIWTNDGKLLIGPIETNFDDILIEIHTFSFKKIHFKMSSRKWRPFSIFRWAYPYPESLLLQKMPAFPAHVNIT